MAHRIAPGEITIASMNLHCGVRSGGQHYDVATAIRGLDAQLIALQETWSADTGPDPVAASADALGAQLLRVPLSPVTSRARLGIAADQTPGRFGMAVLSAFPIIDYAVVGFGWAPGDVVSRCAQILTIELPGGAALRIAATHLTHRLISPAQLWRLLRRLGGLNVPTVIAGDLNMPRLIAGLTPGYSPAVQGRTWPAELPLMQLDHVLISRGIDKVASAVLPPAGSDHLAVRARIKVRVAASGTASTVPGNPARSSGAETG